MVVMEFIIVIFGVLSFLSLYFLCRFLYWEGKVKKDIEKLIRENTKW